MPQSNRPYCSWVVQLTNWKQITSDPWILEAIQGYKIEFWKQTTQACLPVPLHFSKKDTQLMNTKYPVLLSLLFNFPHLIRYSSDQLLSQESLPPSFQPQAVQLAIRSTSGVSVMQKKFSKQTSKLLLALWRDRSTKAYNSLFHKWECWYVLTGQKSHFWLCSKYF